MFTQKSYVIYWIYSVMAMSQKTTAVLAVNPKMLTPYDQGQITLRWKVLMMATRNPAN